MYLIHFVVDGIRACGTHTVIEHEEAKRRSALIEARKRTVSEALNQFNFHTSLNGAWRVAVRLDDDRVCITDPSKYANEATATLAAIAAHNAKPFMNYVAVRG